MQPKIDWEREAGYWQDEFGSRPYVPQGASYDDYGPAYRYGVETYPKYRDRSFDDIDSELESGWDRARGASRLTWNEARYAAKDSVERVRNALERDPAAIAGP